MNYLVEYKAVMDDGKRNLTVSGKLFLTDCKSKKDAEEIAKEEGFYAISGACIRMGTCVCAPIEQSDVEIIKITELLYEISR